MKRVVAVFLVAMVCLSLTANSVRAEGALSDFFDMIKKWFEASPFGNLFSMPVKRMETMKLSFYPETFEMEIEEFVNISTSATEIFNFKGSMNVDMGNKSSMVLEESGTTLVINEKIGTINFEGFRINSLELKGMKLVITSGNWNETTENGTITIKDFLGTCIVREGVINLEGNVSKLIKA